MPTGQLKHGGFASYSLEYVALGLLVAGPKHGYGLYQDFSRAFDEIWNAEQARFYAVLTALEEKKYLQVTTEAQDKRPARKVYSLTDTGLIVFLDWLQRPVTSMRAIRVEFIAKLRFYAILKMEGAGQLIDNQIDTLRIMLAEWEKSPGGGGANQPDLFQSVVVGEFRKRQARFIIDWLAACKENGANVLFAP